MINRFLVTRVVLALLFFIVTVLQIFSFPGQFTHMRKASGISLLLEIVLTLAVALLFLCAQVAIYSLWKLISHMQSGTFYSLASLNWINRFVAAVRTALIFPILLILIIAPQADDPGVLVMLSAITFFVGSIYLMSSLLRDQIQNKVAD
jgi:hypothetical protein